MLTTLRRRARRGMAAVRGYKVYALSVALAAVDAAPDILAAVGGVDWTPLLPAGWGLKVGGWLAVARLVAPIVTARLRRPPPGAPR